MKSYEELARGALARAKEKKKKRHRRIGICASVFAVVIAVTAAVLLWKHPLAAPAEETVPYAAPASDAAPESMVENVAGEGQPNPPDLPVAASDSEIAANRNSVSAKK